VSFQSLVQILLQNTIEFKKYRLMRTVILTFILLTLALNQSYSQEFFKDTLHCGCIFKLHSISKDPLGNTVYLGKVIVDVNGDFVDYGPGFASVEAFYSAVPTRLPAPKKAPVIARPPQPEGKSDSLWGGRKFGDPHHKF
jgi:hypothetical protein